VVDAVLSEQDRLRIFFKGTPEDNQSTIWERFGLACVVELDPTHGEKASGGGIPWQKHRDILDVVNLRLDLISANASPPI
jgi:hypothetical protein